MARNQEHRLRTQTDRARRVVSSRSRYNLKKTLKESTVRPEEIEREKLWESTFKEIQETHKPSHPSE